MSEFTHEIAKPGNLPLAISIAGYAKSGKTLSSLLLASGIQQVKGGEVWQIDTENRGNEYANRLRYQRVQLKPPYSANRYREAVKYAFDHGARIIVIDSMSHEHDGPGGYLEQHEQYLWDRCNGKEPTDTDRYKHGQAGWARVSQPRKRFESYLEELRDHEDVVPIFCFRANLKYVPKTKDDKLRMSAGEQRADPTDLNWKVTSTSDIPFICSVSLLLVEGEAGTQLVKPTTEAEKRLILRTDTYGPYLQTVKQLDESVGRKLYELAKGSKPASSAPTKQAKYPSLLFHRNYPGHGKGQIEWATPGERVAYLEWLVGMGGSGKPYEDHCALVQKLIEDDIAAEAEQHLGAAE